MWPYTVPSGRLPSTCPRLLSRHRHSRIGTHRNADATRVNDVAKAFPENQTDRCSLGRGCVEGDTRQPWRRGSSTGRGDGILISLLYPVGMRFSGFPPYLEKGKNECS